MRETDMKIKLAVFGAPVREVEVPEGATLEEVLKEHDPKLYKQWKALTVTARVMRKNAD